jgi:hypothetical protein
LGWLVLAFFFLWWKYGFDVLNLMIISTKGLLSFFFFWLIVSWAVKLLLFLCCGVTLNVLVMVFLCC